VEGVVSDDHSYSDWSRRPWVLGVLPSNVGLVSNAVTLAEVDHKVTAGLA
jgi:hypothetical protein